LGWELGALGLGFRSALLHGRFLGLIEGLLVIEILAILSLDNGGSGLREVLVREVSIRSHIGRRIWDRVSNGFSSVSRIYRKERRAMGGEWKAESRAGRNLRAI